MTSSARLQHEADSTRAGLSHTLDELRNSVITAALTNGAMTFAKEGSATIARAAIDKAAASPLAALLIGAGVFMLLTSDKNSTAGNLVDRANSAIKGAASALGSAAGATASGTRDAASGAVSAAKRAADGVTDAASGVASYVSDTASGAMQAANSGLDKAKGLLADGETRATQTLHDAEDLMATTTDRFVKFAEEQPILVAALGVALGAAIGSALPVTEKRYMGEAGAMVTEKGREIASKVADTVTDKIAGADVGGKMGEMVDAVAKTVTTELYPKA